MVSKASIIVCLNCNLLLIEKKTFLLLIGKNHSRDLFGVRLKILVAEKAFGGIAKFLNLDILLVLYLFADFNLFHFFPRVK